MKKNAYLPRAIEASLLDAAKQFPCINIYGPRQVGKSTLVETLFHTFHYVTLDDADDLYLALNNPKGFLSIHSWPLIIDEVQRVPNLLLEIKRIVDAEKKLWLLEGKTKQLMFVLTGSNQFELQNAICESLAGRTAVFHLFSLTTLEADNISGSLFKPDIGELLLKEKDFQGKVYNKKQIFEIIFRGGMPEPVALGTNRDVFFLDIGANKGL